MRLAHGKGLGYQYGSTTTPNWALARFFVSTLGWGPSNFGKTNLIERFQALQCKHGYLTFTIFWRMCVANLQDTIIPFPLHSSSAAL